MGSRVTLRFPEGGGRASWQTPQRSAADRAAAANAAYRAQQEQEAKRLAKQQEDVYTRVLDSPDYQQLLHMDEACIHCDSGEKTKDCHSFDPEGVLAENEATAAAWSPRCRAFVPRAW